jgi:EAL domain-containing protein (putative c-di-GMP-specific phosphodiesterase class I)
MACDEFQGYLFSHPLSADATLEAWQATASNDASQAL